jgi:hypothetical protein
VERGLKSLDFGGMAARSDHLRIGGFRRQGCPLALFQCHEHPPRLGIQIGEGVYQMLQQRTVAINLPDEHSIERPPMSLSR